MKKIIKATEEPVKHSKNYEKVKRFYDNGLWNLTMVHNAVGRWITPEEYFEITGETYTA